MMISSRNAQSSLEVAAAEFKAMTYQELERYAFQHQLFDTWQSRTLSLDGHNVVLNLMFGRVGRFRKRISVEMTLTDTQGNIPGYPCIYFERFESGGYSPSLHYLKWEPWIWRLFLTFLIGGLVIIAALGIWLSFR